METNNLHKRKPQGHNILLGIYILSITLVVSIFSIIKIAPYL